MHSKYKSI